MLMALWVQSLAWKKQNKTKQNKTKNQIGLFPPYIFN
jgi:hypothetical protein